MDYLLFLFIVIGISLTTFFYLIKSLIDMWREYATTKNETILLLFILNIVGFFLSASIMSIIISIVFYWKRSKVLCCLGMLLFLIGPFLLIILGLSTFLSFANS